MSEDMVKYAITQGIKLGIAAYKNEEALRRSNPRILIVKSEAERMVGGRMILKSLEKRGFIFPYRFDTKEMLDEDGEPFKAAQGRIYFKLCELEKALEDGNLYKGFRETRKQLQ